MSELIKSNLSQSLKLKAMSLLFSETVTDKGKIYSENDWIDVNTPVYVLAEDGTIANAEDGEYNTPEMVSTSTYSKTFVVKDGIVTEVKNVSSYAETTEAIATPTEDSTTVEPVVGDTATEEVIKQSEQTPETEENRVIVTLRETLNELSEVKDAYLKLRSELDALAISFDNLTKGENKTIEVNDKKTSKEKLHPIWSVK